MASAASSASVVARPLAAIATSPAPTPALVGAAEEGERRAQQDQQVGERRAVVDVPYVELDPLVPGERGAAVDLRPAGDPGQHLEAPPLAIGVLLDLVPERRPGTDHAHLAAHDVPQLRQLVDRGAAEHAADASDPAVAPVDRIAGALLLGADDHRPQLQQLEVD